MKKQFDNVSGAYGSPMGRWEHQNPEPVPHSVRCFRVHLDSGGYDDGGAYWGTGKPLYCFEQSEHETRNAYGNRVYFRVFVRAESRLQAVAACGISRHLLKKAPMADYLKLRYLEAKGCISASGVLLRQKLQNLGFEG